MNIKIPLGFQALHFLILSQTSSFARVGETEEQCLARYGKILSREVSDETKRVLINYEIKNGVRVVAEFKANKCLAMIYRGDILNTIIDLRDKNSKSKWDNLGENYDPKLGVNVLWFSNDKANLYARIIKKDGAVTLVVMDKSLTEMRKKEEESRIKDF